MTADMGAQDCDVLVVGAGIAGASIAAEAAEHGAGRVVVVEAESQPGYHTTGRSAAFWEECYGGPEIVPLTMASGTALREGGFLTPRGALYLSREQDRSQVDAFMERFADSGVTIERIDGEAIRDIVPGVRPEWSLAITQPHCADIDVASLHQHFLARARAAGVDIRTHHRLHAAERDGAGWLVDLGPAGEMRAGVIVNAAGAWADEVARACGACPLGITPLRRTIAQVRCTPAVPQDLPLVLDISGQFYFKPEAGKLWLSPQDETPSEPCDAAPEELDVALAIDRFEQVVDWRIDAVEHKWAGLRSFAPDRAPVYGFDPRQEGFFWYAGQGGYGIQTSPAGARLGAQLLLRRAADAMTQDIDPAPYAAARFG
ncbi:NAD(P)/FAD-dependent oxidoreductase [Aurantiacibacter flavus]|uniref:FAD-binding oxidoreductase n=1 Tax=Aurantiacibacter flavus TaxID=3145232 RepID=A0ABV0CUW2_9SPHN